MRLFSRYNFFIALLAAMLLAEVMLWIRSYWGNDYIFCRWVSVTDENGHSADLTSRTIRQWRESVGSKFRTRYLAIASRGGGDSFGLGLGRYVVSGDFDPTLTLLLVREENYRTAHSEKGRI